MLECILPLYVRNLREKGRDDMGRMCFELPVEGASGYAIVETELRVEPVLTGDILERLNPGDGFTIHKAGDLWWNVETGKTGMDPRTMVYGQSAGSCTICHL